MTALFQSPNPAVAAVNDLLTASGQDIGSDMASPDWYAGLPDKQRWTEQFASILLPKSAGKKGGDLAERLFAEHLYWLSRKDGRYRKDGWHWRYERMEDLARVFGYASDDPIKRATSILKKAGLLDSNQRYIAGTSSAVNHYRLSDSAHIVLSLLTVAGVGELGRSQWLELLAPTEAGAKPLRDVLEGWQDVKTTEALEAMRAALVKAVARVDPEGQKNLTRAFKDAWNSALKEGYPEATALSMGADKKRMAALVKKLKAEAEEPGAGFTLTSETLIQFATRLASDWHSFRGMVKAEKGETLPATPSLEKLLFHIPLAAKLVFSVAPKGKAKGVKSGWE